MLHERFASVHLKQLRQAQPRKVRELQRSGQLRAYLDQVEADANRLYDTVLKGLRKKNPPTSTDPLESQDNMLQLQAREFVLNERVLVPMPSDESQHDE